MYVQYDGTEQQVSLEVRATWNTHYKRISTASVNNFSYGLTDIVAGNKRNDGWTDTL